MKNRIAIIPARSGSQRLPNKNIMEFNGIPLLKRKVCQILETQLFDVVWVSTDSQEYANIAKSSGADCPILRDQSNDNKTSVGEASAYALKQAIGFFNEEYKYVYQFMPNCPLIRKKIILDYVNYFEKSNFNSSISGFEYGWANPHWAVKISNKNDPLQMFPDSLKKRSQDLDKLLCPTGSIWAAKAEFLLKHNNFYMPGWKMIQIPRYDSADIDDIEDFNFAQIIDMGSEY